MNNMNQYMALILEAASQYKNCCIADNRYAKYLIMFVILLGFYRILESQTSLSIIFMLFIAQNIIATKKYMA